MHFAIDADGRRGLRVIGEIPDLDVCRLEGYNGIGKSAAIRLLELCAGRQPYEGQNHAWRTFRDQLASARVVATRLHGAERVEWILDPTAWPPTPEPLGDRLGQVRIDGHQARSADVRPLLRIHRIAGDETFTDTLAARVRTIGSATSRWMAESGEGWRRRARLDHVLGGLETQLSQYDVARFQAEQRDAEEASRHASQLQGDRQATEERVKVLAEARQLLDRLDDVRGRGPGLDEQLSDLARQLGELGAERSELDEQIVALGERDQHDQQARKEFALAQRLLERRQQEFGEAQARLAEAAGSAQVAPDLPAVKSAQATAKAQLDDLLGRQVRANTAPRVRQLSEELIGLLRRAEGDGLGEEVLVESVSGGASWTTRRLLEALERQVTVRAAQPISPAAERLAEQIERARARIQSLADVVAAHASIAEATRRLQQAEERMQAATAALPATAATTVQGLLAERSKLDGQIAALTGRLAQVEQSKSLLGGGLTEQVLAERLTRACETVGVDASRIGGELTGAERRLERLREAEPAARRRADELRQRMEQRVREIGRTVAGLHRDPNVAWLHGFGDDLPVPGIDADVEKQVEALARLGAVLPKARAGLTDFYRQVRAIGVALTELGDQLHARSSGSADWLPEVRMWLTREVEVWFDHAEVREALFPGGGAVELDLAEMTVSWTPQGQERQTKSLHAFSSGEQALAYTRARLASVDLDGEDAANRLVALDEFGAFIAANWMRNLAGYLHDRHRRFPREQILVVLPVSDDLQARPQALQDAGLLADAVDNVTVARRRQLRDRGYFTERLTV